MILLVHTSWVKFTNVLLKLSTELVPDHPHAKDNLEKTIVFQFVKVLFCQSIILAVIS